MVRLNGRSVRWFEFTLVIHLLIRLKAWFRGRGIDCDGSAVYDADERSQWRGKLDTAAVDMRADRLRKEIACLVPMCEEAEQELVAEVRKHAATRILTY
jgi:hypothetical protein